MSLPALSPTRPSGSSPVQPASAGATLARHSVTLACAATTGVHLLSLTRQLGPDEGGFSMVARYADAGGGYLYGPQWVDRPPGLIGVFAVADQLGPYGARLVAAALATALVAAVAWAADAVGGRPAARWAAWTGFAFASSVLLQAQRLNGELAAATFVAVSIAAVSHALLVPTTRARTAQLGLLGGASAAIAVLMKQSFVDAFVFVGVLLLVGSWTRANRLRYRSSRIVVTLGAFAAGAAVPAVATVWWAHDHGGLRALLFAMVGFRVDAAAVMAHWSLAAPLSRAGALLVTSALSGLLLLLAHLAYVHRRRLLRPDPLPWAVAATVAVELVGVAAGGNFWEHYLIGLIPTVALAAGMSIGTRVRGAAGTRALVVLACTVTAVVSPVAAVSAAQTASAAYTSGRWVAASAHPDDTLVVPFTHANVVEDSGLKPGYPYAWSLPVRTLDPRLDLLTSTLTGPEAPTWVVRWDASDSWGLDPDHRVASALRAHYRSVARICGHAVWLHDGETRQLAPAPPAGACGTGDQ